MEQALCNENKVVKPLESSVASKSGAVFQDKVCERLRSLCGSAEEAAVLAEYVATLADAKKNWEDEMMVELKSVFKNTAQMKSFIEWVRTCKANPVTTPAFPTAGSPGSPNPTKSPTKLVAPSTSAASKPPKATKPAITDKQQLLLSMTQQLQLILTKLNNKSITDEMREKYQALAQNIKRQMSKISQPKASSASRFPAHAAPVTQPARPKIQW